MSCCKSTELKRQLQYSVALCLALRSSFSSFVYLSNLYKMHLSSSPRHHLPRAVQIKYVLKYFLYKTPLTSSSWCAAKCCSDQRNFILKSVSKDNKYVWVQFEEMYIKWCTWHQEYLYLMNGEDIKIWSLGFEHFTWYQIKLYLIYWKYNNERFIFMHHHSNQSALHGKYRLHFSTAIKWHQANKRKDFFPNWMLKISVLVDLATP